MRVVTVPWETKKNTLDGWLWGPFPLWYSLSIQIAWSPKRENYSGIRRLPTHVFVDRGTCAPKPDLSFQGLRAPSIPGFLRPVLTGGLVTLPSPPGQADLPAHFSVKVGVLDCQALRASSVSAFSKCASTPGLLDWPQSMHWAALQPPLPLSQMLGLWFRGPGWACTTIGIAPEDCFCLCLESNNVQALRW